VFENADGMEEHGLLGLHGPAAFRYCALSWPSRFAAGEIRLTVRKTGKAPLLPIARCNALLALAGATQRAVASACGG
jgi:hypothetical protein